jgi:hypothetical protein
MGLHSSPKLVDNPLLTDSKATSITPTSLSWRRYVDEPLDRKSKNDAIRDDDHEWLFTMEEHFY